MRHSLFLVVLLYMPSAWATEVQVIEAMGMHAYLVENHSLPIISASVTFKGAGAVQDAETQAGLSAMAARLLSEGAGKRDAKAFQEALESRAISLSAAVSSDHVSVSLKTLREHREEAFALLNEMIHAPRFDADALERVRTEMLTVLRVSESRPDYQLSRLFDESLMGDHSYHIPTSGTEVSLAAINQEALRQWHETRFARNNMIVSIAGAVSAEEVKQLLYRLSESLPLKVSLAEVPSHEFPAEGVWYEQAMDVPQSVVRFAAPAVERDDPRFYTAYTLMHILGGSGLNSILADELRKKRGYTYSIYTGLDGLEYAAYWEGQFATKAGQVRDAIATLETALAEVAQGGITQQQRDDAVAYLTGSFPLNMDTSAKLVQYLTLMQLRDLGVDYLEKRNGYFEQVTAEDLSVFAAEFLRPENLSILHVGRLTATAADGVAP